MANASGVPAAMDTQDRPQVVILPSLLYAIGFIAVLLLDWLHPLLVLQTETLLWRPAMALLVPGLILLAWSAATLRQNGTSSNPGEAANRLVCEGPYRLSRNPMYLALALVFLGGTLLINSWWGPLISAPLIAITHYGVIRREETYLSARFGAAYSTYRRRVRRYF